MFVFIEKKMVPHYLPSKKIYETSDCSIKKKKNLVALFVIYLKLKSIIYLYISFSEVFVPLILLASIYVVRDLCINIS